MATPNEPIPSSRVKLFLLPRNSSQLLPLGFVEDFSAQMQYRSENIMEIGSFVPPDNVVNYGEGRVRWGKVHQVNPEVRRILAPTIANAVSFRQFSILAMDPVDNQPLALIVDALPEMIDLNVRGGAAARSNFSGIARFALFGDEVKEAAA